jgi:uncharacterized protein (DUF1015 family)
MAAVHPFRALRYQTDRRADLTSVLAPPYDVINADGQRELYARDAENIIRLEYGLQAPDDSASDNRYTRAATTQADWLRDGVLTVEERPSLYVHRQRFIWDGETYTRTGFFAAVELQPFDEGDVLPHEWTLKGPKVDRLELMRACETSFSPVFGLYDGRDLDVTARLAEIMAGAPMATAEGQGFDEALWRVDDPALVAAITGGLATKQILIADGHHRYETALALRDEMRARYPNAPATAPFNYALMLLVDLHDPGLLVLPTHRTLILTEPMRAAIDAVIAKHFTATPLPDAAAALAALEASAGSPTFVWYAQGQYRLLEAPAATRDGLPLLDVQALQEWIIAPLFAADSATVATVESHVRYTIDPAEAAARVDRGEAQAAVLLNGTPVADVLTLAAHGVRLPQKSTYFYPKVPTGLVMLRLRPELTVG